MQKKSTIWGLNAILIVLTFYICAFMVGYSALNGSAKEDDRVEIDNIINQDLTTVDIADDYDGDEDGLTHQEELSFGTDTALTDTDMDGLTDYTEINETKTNPLKYDTDGDGLCDGVEIEVGLDPLNKKTNGSKDSDRKFDFTYNIESLELNVSGNANVANTYAGIIDYVNVKNTPGVVSNLYEFYLRGNKFDKASITFRYDEDEVRSLGCTEDHLRVYQFMDDGTFVEVGGLLDLENNTITCELEHFSKYVIADHRKINKQVETNVYILLDNSGSMYPKELCEGSEENDVDFKRVDMAKKLISMTDENVKYGLGKFTATFTSLASGFTNSKDTLYEKLDSIKTTGETFSGTYIAKSIRDALANFDSSTNNNRKFIILLTDGATTEGGLWDFSLYDENSAIKDAIKKNVAIIVVGLGSSINTEYLTKIANSTGGFYIYAKDADALDVIYKTLMATLNYKYTDLDGDGTSDSILVADSGFDATKNGWGFKNFMLKIDDGFTNGQCAGLSAFAQLYYLDKLPLTGNAIEKYQATGLWFINRSYLWSDSYDISNVDFFSSRRNLNDFELISGWNSISSRKYSEISYQDTNNPTYFKLNTDIMQIADASDIIEVKTYNTEKKVRVGDKDCESYDNYYYDLDVDKSKLTGDDVDMYNVLMAIHNLYATQSMDSRYITYDIKSMSFSEAMDTQHMNKQFDAVIDALNRGVPLIVSGEGHAINAMRLYRDIDNPLEYRLICYDNNYPNTEKTITIRLSERHGLGKIDMYGWNNVYEYNILDTDNIFQKGENKGINIKFKECK